MLGNIDIPDHLDDITAAIAEGMVRVGDRFDRQAIDELAGREGGRFEPVEQLVRHVERYRGKMFRPALVMLFGMAASAKDGQPGDITDDLITLGATCEMVHMATLVHDDVLDEADTRRGGLTVNNLRGNEAAVLLGDLLVAAAFELSTQVGEVRTASLIGRMSMRMCAGELLQLSHREDFSLDEPTYFEIVRRKTGELIALCCKLGALHGGASDEVQEACHRFGMEMGVAFQIRDDLLDLTGEEDAVGKPVGRDLAMAKPTLPIIHYLAASNAADRSDTLALLRSAADDDAGRESVRRELLQRLAGTGSVQYASDEATRRIALATDGLNLLPASGARDLLRVVAGAAVQRSK